MDFDELTNVSLYKGKLKHQQQLIECHDLDLYQKISIIENNRRKKI